MGSNLKTLLLKHSKLEALEWNRPSSGALVCNPARFHRRVERSHPIGQMYIRTPSMRTPTKPARIMSGGSLASLDRDIQTQIGGQLRVAYDDIVQQGIPDRFAALLSELDKTPRIVSGKQTRRS